jgi:hypothetical protein
VKIHCWSLARSAEPGVFHRMLTTATALRVVGCFDYFRGFGLRLFFP